MTQLYYMYGLYVRYNFLTRKYFILNENILIESNVNRNHVLVLVVIVQKVPAILYFDTKVPSYAYAGVVSLMLSILQSCPNAPLLLFRYIPVSAAYVSAFSNHLLTLISQFAIYMFCLDFPVHLFSYTYSVFLSSHWLSLPFLRMTLNSHHRSKCDNIRTSLIEIHKAPKLVRTISSPELNPLQSLSLSVWEQDELNCSSHCQVK